jgi:hypothetical protein
MTANTIAAILIWSWVAAWALAALKLWWDAGSHSRRGDTRTDPLRRTPTL